MSDKNKKPFRENLYDWLYKITYNYQRNKTMLDFIEKKNKYLKMTDDEFLMEYVNVTAKHERKKLILIFSIPVIIALLFNIGNVALTVIGKLSFSENYKLIENEITNNAIIEIVLILTTVLFAFGIFFIIIFINQFYTLAKDKRTIEEIKSIRN